jgi:chromosome segregation ATPase
MDATKFATPEAENAVLRKIVEELKEELDEKNLRMLELELENEKMRDDYDRKLNEQISNIKAISTEAANYKIKGDLERKANDGLQKEKLELQEVLKECKITADKQKRRIAELEIELEKSFNCERVLRDKVEELEHSQESAMEKVADLETRLMDMEQRARDADYFPMPVRPTEANLKVNGEIENKNLPLKNVIKKKESRNSVQVIDDLIGIIEKFEKLLFKEDDNSK